MRVSTNEKEKMREKMISEIFTWIIGTESENNVAVVWHSNRILGRRQIKLPVKQSSLVEIQRVLQVDLLHVFVGRTSDTDDVERVSVQMEGMRQIRLLYCKEKFPLALPRH